MTGLSGAPAADKDTNLFSLRRRSINRRSRGRSTGCGSEKKFRNVHSRYARRARWPTPSVLLKRAIIAPETGRWEAIFFAERRIVLHCPVVRLKQLERAPQRQPPSAVQHGRRVERDIGF